MSYPQNYQQPNDPPQQVPQPQPPAQQPQPPQQQQQARGPVIVHTQQPDSAAALSAQLNSFSEQLATVPERLVQAMREANPPQQPPQQFQQPQQQPQQQQQVAPPQQQGTGLSAAPQSPLPASPDSGNPPALPPGMSQTRANILTRFFGR